MAQRAPSGIDPHTEYRSRFSGEISLPPLKSERLHKLRFRAGMMEEREAKRTRAVS